MAVTVTHAFVSAIADDAAATAAGEVTPTRWNAGHTLSGAAALTKTDDTNVTLTLGGTPTTALLEATSLTLGWTGTLSIARGGTGAATAAAARVNLGVRNVISANTTYYVRTDGSDSNDGLTDSAGGAFLTIGKAMTVVSQIDFNGYVVTVQVRAGTYTEAVSVPKCVGQADFSKLIIIGDTTTPANVIVTQSGSSVGTFEVPQGAQCYLKGFKIAASSGYGIACRGGYVKWGFIEFGACSDSCAYCESGLSESYENCSYSANSGTYAKAFGSGFIKIIGNGAGSNTITATGGTRNFSNAFVDCQIGAGIQSSGMAFSGTTTGTRYGIQTNGVIFTNGAGATYFPGDVGGYAVTGGQYG